MCTTGCMKAMTAVFGVLSVLTWLGMVVLSMGVLAAVKFLPAFVNLLDQSLDTVDVNSFVSLVTILSIPLILAILAFIYITISIIANIFTPSFASVDILRRVRDRLVLMLFFGLLLITVTIPAWIITPVASLLADNMATHNGTAVLSTDTEAFLKSVANLVTFLIGVSVFPALVFGTCAWFLHAQVWAKVHKDKTIPPQTTPLILSAPGPAVISAPNPAVPAQVPAYMAGYPLNAQRRK